MKPKLSKRLRRNLLTNDWTKWNLAHKGSGQVAGVGSAVSATQHRISSALISDAQTKLHQQTAAFHTKAAGIHRTNGNLVKAKLHQDVADKHEAFLSKLGKGLGGAAAGAAGTLGGEALGSTIGAWGGGALGSLAGPVGTAAGAAIGGVAGGGIGALAGGYGTAKAAGALAGKHAELGAKIGGVTAGLSKAGYDLYKGAGAIKGAISQGRTAFQQGGAKAALKAVKGQAGHGLKRVGAGTADVAKYGGDAAQVGKELSISDKIKAARAGGKLRTKPNTFYRKPLGNSLPGVSLAELRKILAKRMVSNSTLQKITFNFSGGGVKRVTHNGKDYLVAPLTMIVPGILHGSKGPLLYREQDISQNVAAWNHIPLTLQHPSIAGTPCSAKSKGVWAKQGLGFVRNAKYKGKLVAEGWFDAERTKRISPETYNALTKGQPIELSTGLFTENVPVKNGATHKGRQYTHIATNFKPDHLAILPDRRGACSIKDGCGVMINDSKLRKIVDTYITTNFDEDESRDEVGRWVAIAHSIPSVVKAKELSNMALTKQDHENAATEHLHAYQDLSSLLGVVYRKSGEPKRGKSWHKIADMINHHWDKSSYHTVIASKDPDVQKKYGSANNEQTNNHIVKLKSGKYRLLSPKGKNLGTFDSHDAAAKHEGKVEYFKANQVSNGWTGNAKVVQIVNDWFKWDQEHSGDSDMARRFGGNGDPDPASPKAAKAFQASEYANSKGTAKAHLAAAQAHDAAYKENHNPIHLQSATTHRTMVESLPKSRGLASRAVGGASGAAKGGFLGGLAPVAYHIGRGAIAGSKTFGTTPRAKTIGAISGGLMGAFHAWDHKDQAKLGAKIGAGLGGAYGALHNEQIKRVKRICTEHSCTIG